MAAKANVKTAKAMAAKAKAKTTKAKAAKANATAMARMAKGATRRIAPLFLAWLLAIGLPSGDLPARAASAYAVPSAPCRAFGLTAGEGEAIAHDTTAPSARQPSPDGATAHDTTARAASMRQASARLTSVKSLSLVVLSDYKRTMDIGEEFWLVAVASNGAIPTFKSSNSKVASVNTYGLVTAKKAGTAKITAKVKKGEASCKITVKKTTVRLSKKSVSLEHGETFRLSAEISTDAPATWKSSKKSVASVDEDGLVTALKPGETTITVTADSTKATCTVKVRQPTIRLNKSSLTLRAGETFQFSAKVSSGLAPEWKSSKKSVAVIDENGALTAIKAGTTTVTAKLDGVSKFCQVTVKPEEE